MADTAWRIKEAVRHTLDELPAEKLEEVSDFVLFLKKQELRKTGAVYRPSHPLH